MSRRVSCAAVGVALIIATGHATSASPTLPMDDPEYLELERLRGLGRLQLYSGGIRPLTEARVHDLLVEAGVGGTGTAALAPRGGLWLRAFRRATVRFDAFSDDAVPYSTPARPIGVLGNVSVSCEYNEGRPCGTGVGLVSEIDSAAGYGRWISSFTRVQLPIGSDNYRTGPLLDRGYVNLELGPVYVEAGRDVLVLGPAARAQMLVGDNAAPLDLVRLSTSRPLKIPKIPVAVSALGAVGRLRDPQRWHDTLLTVLRLQLDLFDQFELGASHILELEGDGAPHLSFGEAIAEHFTRKDDGMGGDYSNRRVSFDATYTMKFLLGARVYYEVAFEDLRKHIVDAWVYDGDHVAGVEFPILTRAGEHGFVVEFQHTGIRSQSHTRYTSGMTNAGFTLGSPLGPDAWSVYATARLDVGAYRVWPWVELVRRSSDTYTTIDYGPIYRSAYGTEETRARLGVRGEVILRPSLRVDVRALYEHVTDFAFVPGAVRDNGGIEASLTWAP